MGRITFELTDENEAKLRKYAKNNDRFLNISDFCRICTFMVIKTLEDPGFSIIDGKLKPIKISPGGNKK